MTDLVVIGSGPAGVLVALRAVEVAQVAAIAMWAGLRVDQLMRISLAVPDVHGQPRSAAGT